MTQVRHNPRAVTGRRYDRRGLAFTMVELIVTLAVASILMGLGTGIYKTIATGGVDSAARMVGKQLMLARQYAITNRTHVALLLPDAATSPALPKSYHNGSFLVCRVTPTGATPAFTFGSTIQGVPWVFLPSKCFVNDFENNAMDVSLVPTPPGSSGATSTVRAIVFSPRGGLAIPLTVDDLAIAFDDPSDGKNRRVALQVNWMTGKVTYSK